VYEVKKLEKELRIPDEQAVENVIDCNFRNGPCPQQVACILLLQT
jgi:hypothetical protein